MIKRKKTLCKKRGHALVTVKREIAIWPHEITQYLRCSKCNKRMSARKVIL